MHLARSATYRVKMGPPLDILRTLTDVACRLAVKDGAVNRFCRVLVPLYRLDEAFEPEA